MFKTKKDSAPKHSATAGQSQTAETPWSLAERLHEDRTLRVQAQVKNWRIFAFMSLAVAAIGVGGAVGIGMQSKYVPMVIEVDKLGQTLAVRALHGDAAITDPARLAYREMFDLIENLRTVSTDRQANNDRIKKGFSRLKGAAEKYVRTELRKAPPNEVGATKTVQVVVRSALKTAGKTWQIDWEERSYSLTGDLMTTEKWRATVQYELNPSGEERIFRGNPIGFEVADLTWQPLVQ